MKCPHCKAWSFCLETRTRRRRYECVNGHRFTTEQYAQVKPYNPATGKTGRGEMALPVSTLKAVQ